MYQWNEWYNTYDSFSCKIFILIKHWKKVKLSGKWAKSAGKALWKKELEKDKPMVLILDGNTEHVAHVWRKIGLFEQKNILFVTAFDLIKCLEHVK